MPDALSRLIYPIDKSHLAPMRLLHFLALAIVVSRLTPPDWHGLMKPSIVAMIRCGENSLAMYCLSICCHSSVTSSWPKFPAPSLCKSLSAVPGSP
jgi:hypothetical protein